MAIYHFSGQIMSRISKHTGKPKSPLAAAAYRSGEKLVDEVDNQSFFYKRDIVPVTHILVPTHAPDWTRNREKLWNEVNRIERNYNAQFAREFNVALPVELTNEQQERLTLDYCQEAFVDRGMVADIAIHRDDKNNPHFHVMLTIRPFSEDGTWGVKAKREYKFDKDGEHILDKNGKKAFNKVDTTDWNNKEVFKSWRKLWAEKANQYLEKFDVDQSISHLSNEDLGIKQMPTIHEGYVARQMEKNGQKSERVSFNKEVKKYNQLVSDLHKYKAKKEQLNYQNKFVRKFSPIEKQHLSNIARELKMFVNIKTISERKGQLKAWRKSIQFTLDNESKLNQLSRIEKELNLINEAEEIFNSESTRFIRQYYHTWDVDCFSLDEKIALVEKTITNKVLLSDDEIHELDYEVSYENLLKEINEVLRNRYAFVLTINQRVEKLETQRSVLKKKLNISVTDLEKTIKEASIKYPEEFQVFRKNIKDSRDLHEARKLITELYNLEINKWYPSVETEKLTLEEKEILVVGTEYYEKPITLENIPLLQKYSIEEQVKLIRLLTSDDEKRDECINKDFPNFQVNNPRYLMLFKDECIRNIDKLPKYEFNKLKGIDPIQFALNEIDSSLLIKDLNAKMDEVLIQYSSNNSLSFITSGIASRLFQDILEKRDFASKKQFEDDLKSRKPKRKNIHQGPSL